MSFGSDISGGSMGGMTDDSSSTGDAYWCAQEAEDTAADALQRVVGFGQDRKYTGRQPRWVRSLRAYYAMDATIGNSMVNEPRPSGEQGELLMMQVNQYRNFAQHILNLVTRDALAFDAISHDMSGASQAASDLAGRLLEALTRDHQLDRVIRLATEWAVVCDEGYILTGWDPSAGPLGEPVPQPGGGYKRQPMGDICVEVFGPHDVFFDQRASKFNRDYVIVRRWVNRWDLIAKYPELKSNIVGLKTRDKQENGLGPLWTNIEAKSDDICMFELYHRKTDAIPNGRYMRFCDRDTVFMDGPLPYEEIPIERVSAGDFLDSGTSYTSLYDILGLQYALNAVMSSTITIADLAGVPNIAVPDGSSFTTEDLGGAGRLVKYTIIPGAENGGMPKMMPVPEVPEVHIKLLGAIPQMMESILAVNSVVRGEPSDNIKAGNYAALMAQQTAEFYTPLRRSVISASERMATHMLRCFATYATDSRVLDVEGVYRGKTTLSFMGKDLQSIRRVKVDVGNPMQDTAAGRRMLADSLLEHYGPTGLSVDKYLQVIKTGRLDPIFDPTQTEVELIEEENTLLSQFTAPPPIQDDPKSMHDFTVALGAVVAVDKTDDHALHITHHRCVLHDPELRKNPSVLSAVHAHIAMHQAQMMPPPGPTDTSQRSTGPGGPPASDQPHAPTPPAPGEARNAGVRPAQPATPPAGAPRPSMQAPRPAT